MSLLLLILALSASAFKIEDALSELSLLEALLATTRFADSYTKIEKGCVGSHNIRKYTRKTVDECAKICNETPNCKAFEFGVHYGGRGGYNPGDCQPQSSANPANCDGQHHNLDLYVPRVAPRCGDGKCDRNEASRGCVQDCKEEIKEIICARQKKVGSCAQSCSAELKRVNALHLMDICGEPGENIDAPFSEVCGSQCPECPSTADICDGNKECVPGCKCPRCMPKMPELFRGPCPSSSDICAGKATCKILCPCPHCVKAPPPPPPLAVIPLPLPSKCEMFGHSCELCKKHGCVYERAHRKKLFGRRELTSIARVVPKGKCKEDTRAMKLRQICPIVFPKFKPLPKISHPKIELKPFLG